MQAMIVSVFKRLQKLPPSIPVEDLGLDTALSTYSVSDGLRTPTTEESQIRMSAPDPTSGAIPAASTPAPDSSNVQPLMRTSSSASVRSTSGYSNGQSVPHSPTITQGEEEPEQRQESKPYGLPSIKEILRVLISLLNPHDQQHTDSMRLMSLGLLNIAFEVGGKSVGHHPILRALVADELCKYLFQVSHVEIKATLHSLTEFLGNIAGTLGKRSPTLNFPSSHFKPL